MQDGNPRDDAGTGAPPTGGQSMVASVGSLMEERRRYELWLAALNARRAETPKHVFSRVHADYTARLEAVMSRLTGQVEGLRGELTVLTTRIASLEEQQHRARDQRAEAELRAHVGEMTAEEWATAAKAADDHIAALVREHAEAQDALARTREFLADAERPATPPLPAPAVAEAPLQPPRGTTNVPVQRSAPSGAVPRLRPLPGREEPAPPAVASAPEPPAASEPAREGGNFDELAFLSSVVDEGAVPPAAPSPAPHSAPPTPTSAPATAFTPVARPQPPAAAAAKVQPVARPAPPPSRNPFAKRAQDKIINNDGATGPKIESKQVGARSGLAANVSGNNPIVLRDKSNESAKTLKCGECGAANYPTEWYCERCGAELASL